MDLSCDPGWQARPGSASCMQFVDGQATIAGWHDAEVHCQRLGGSLLVINDEQERVGIKSVQLSANEWPGRAGWMIE